MTFCTWKVPQLLFWSPLFLWSFTKPFAVVFLRTCIQMFLAPTVIFLIWLMGLNWCICNMPLYFKSVSSSNIKHIVKFVQVWKKMLSVRIQIFLIPFFSHIDFNLQFDFILLRILRKHCNKKCYHGNKPMQTQV